MGSEMCIRDSCVNVQPAIPAQWHPRPAAATGSPPREALTMGTDRVAGRVLIATSWPPYEQPRLLLPNQHCRQVADASLPSKWMHVDTVQNSSPWFSTISQRQISYDVRSCQGGFRRWYMMTRDGFKDSRL